MVMLNRDKICSANWRQAAYFGHQINRDLPLFVVAHDTAGRSAQSTVDYLATSSRKVSYHVIIDRDGIMTQMVPLDRQAWHAGVSQHPGKPWIKGLNRCSIGVALDNPGELTRATDGTYRAWFGGAWAHSDVERGHRNGRDTWHLPYTARQLTSFEKLVLALDAEYGVDSVLSHHAIAPDRKVDTSPTLDPLLRALTQQVEDKAADMPVGDRAIVATIGGLNLRRGPNINAEIIETMEWNTGVTVEPPIQRTGYVFVTTDDGQAGWAHSQYLQGI
jgi:N-acetylmuramoyl-L-alanine amidase